VKPAQTLKLERDCGVLIGSHDEGEVVELSTLLVRKKHGQTIGEAEVKKKIKAV
jgi:hypothetical protein